MSDLLNITDLSVSVGEKGILDGVNLKIGKGETHVIMGPNGAGKSTLGNAIMGNPNYEITNGKIEFKDEDITAVSVSERAKKGLFLSFQNPIEIPGISLSNFIKNAFDTKTGTRSKLWQFRKDLEKKMDVLNMDYSYADRDLNVGFSGGEKKKAEILQLLMLKPDLAILDETDSGLDVDAVRTVSNGVKDFHDTTDGALIIITHSTRILDALDIDYTHILVNGRIVKTGGPELVEEINKNGFEKYLEN
ncbi:MAG: Fe-S cluster assembly ATPase SufC [Lachnospiraceae bacterium]|nr:Fe-S cluster assembly ATPase SufC [Lachnospiraceae bacterium]